MGEGKKDRAAFALTQFEVVGDFAGEAERRRTTRLCLSWVKQRRTHCEQMSSGLLLKADIARCSRHVSKVPIAEANLTRQHWRRRNVEKRTLSKIRFAHAYNVHCDRRPRLWRGAQAHGMRPVTRWQ